MALDILHDNWGPYTHTEVENALKAYLAVLENRINQAIQSGGVGMADLSAEVQALLYKANTALQPENLAAWAKAQNKPVYTADEITGITGFQNLLAKLQDMDQKIQAAAQSGGVDLNTTMEVTGDALALPATTQAIKTYVDAAISNINAIINTITQDGATAGVIDTFLEVKNFLAGIDTSDPTLYNQLASLNSAILALQGTVAGKANTSDVASTYATKSELTGKQDTLTFDNVPTAGSNNPVKSGGIKTAIDYATPTISQNGKWIIGGVETDVDARGPRGNTVLVNENSQGIQALIVNNVVDGGETDILSAEMGKVIRIAVMTIFNALSPYAFTNGKPVISWGSTAIKHDISVNGVTGGLTISDIYVDNESVAEMPLQILDNKSLSFKLNLPNDAYIFDGVTITMDGIDITENSGVWDETTGIVTINNVTGAVVVVATAATYVQDSLVFNLDCHQGVTLDANDVPIKWTDQKGNIEFDLTGVTQNSAGALVFNGLSSKGIAASGSLVAPFDNCTVEVIGTIQMPQSAGDNMPILANNNGGSAAAGFGRTSSQNNAPYIAVAASPLTGVSQNPYNTAFYYGGGGNIAIAATKTDVLFDGILQNDPWHHPQSAAIVLDLSDYTAGKSDLLSIGYRVHSDTSAEKFFSGTIMAIRIHTRKLSVAEMQANYALDKKRFNLQ